MTYPRLIDCRHLGRDRVIGCWQLGDTLIDPGPTSCLDTVLAGIDVEPKRLLLTHIHLDHAGAAGSLVERFPGLEVFVHERGARHLADPSRLLASAERLYGADMKRLWGTTLPVPEANLRPLAGGERLEGDVEVAYTPGHAKHHVAYLIEGVAYVGDVAGVRIGPSDVLVMPTVPPDFDPSAWLASIRLIEAWGPSRLGLTHFGAVEDVDAHLRRARATLPAAVEAGRGATERAFIRHLRDSVAAAADPATVAAYEQAVPPLHCFLGLRHYLDNPPP
jgi:glyoxylase-like metal-dependent hydrolase (beta-lactamase superfamily II)